MGDGVCTTCVAVLTVLYLSLGRGLVEAVTVTVTPAEDFVANGNNYNFRCNFALDDPSKNAIADWSFTNRQGTTFSDLYKNAGSLGEFFLHGYDSRATFTGDMSGGDVGLEIRALTLADSGTYTCQVSVLGEGKDEASIDITVLDPPGAPLLSISPNPIREDQGVQLTCAMTSGTAPFTYSFHAGDVMLTSGSPTTYDVTNVQRDQTRYTCKVTDVLGDQFAATSLEATLDVHYIDTPQLAPSSPVTGVEGDELSVVCTADANPSATIQWSKDGADQGQGAALTKNPVNRNDAGTYTCTATSSGILGSPSSTSAQLEVEVQYPPDGNPDCTVTTTGNDVMLNCEWQGGNPAAEVTWSHSGGQPIGSAKQSVNQVAAPVLAHNTVYTCTATTPALSAPRTCTVTISVPTVAVSPKPASTAAEGTASHRLSCTVNLDVFPPVESLSWTGPAVTAGRTTGGTLDTPALTIQNVEKSDAGNYTCSASNLAGIGSDYLNLDVLYAPTSTAVVPASVEEKEGDPLTLTCTSDGNPAPTFIWNKQGGSVGLPAGHVVQIQSLSREDAGTYTCTASNGIGNPQAATSTVNVLYLDTPTINTTSPVTLEEGQSTAMQCSAMANPIAGFKWRKDGSSDPEVNGNILTLSEVSRDSEGTYTCEASNTMEGAIETEEASVELIVNYPPSVTVTSGTVTVDENDDVSLSCTADSKPPPTTFTWTDTNGTPLNSQRDGFTLQVTIPDITYQQAGSYTCTASNGVGDAGSAEVDVTVEYPPKFEHSRDPYPVATGASVSLKCFASAVPNNITFSWSRDGSPVSDDRFTVTHSAPGAYHLNINGVQEDDYGTYRCTATNQKGEESDDVILQPYGPPHQPTGLRVLSKDADFKVHIRWTAGFNGGLLTTHTMQLRKKGSTAWKDVGTQQERVGEKRPTFVKTLDLKNEDQGDYYLRVTATNNEPGGASSDFVDLRLEGRRRLYGTLTVDQEWNEALGEVTNEFEKEAEDWEENLDTVFDRFIGYEETKISSFRSGSVVGSFVTVVAESESQAAMDAYRAKVQRGTLGNMTVIPAGSTITDKEPITSPGFTNVTLYNFWKSPLVLAIIAAGGAGILIVSLLTTIMCCESKKKKKMKKRRQMKRDAERAEEETASVGEDNVAFVDDADVQTQLTECDPPPKNDASYESIVLREKDNVNFVRTNGEAIHQNDEEDSLQNNEEDLPQNGFGNFPQNDDDFLNNDEGFPKNDDENFPKNDDYENVFKTDDEDDDLPKNDDYFLTGL
ncbi:HMCN2 [Branchiostoma lanceolatum]|uniref:HMCN2 protein n=1 Tax=Branchiostoma lanceolatum TaxID=7740 RepID=A0A8J9Z7D0_BRALA|nr:HMCN2 [Branchiostoma lanceolatum]